METFVLLGGFAAIAVFGYSVMSRLDDFLNAVQKENERQDERLHLNIATSSLDAVPKVLHVLKSISGHYPDVRFSVSVGKEEDVMQALDTGSADVAVLPAEAVGDMQAQWECISLNPQPVFLDNGMVEMKSIQKEPQPQKILWKHDNADFLISEFLQKLCGQSLRSML